VAADMRTSRSTYLRLQAPASAHLAVDLTRRAVKVVVSLMAITILTTPPGTLSLVQSLTLVVESPSLVVSSVTWHLYFFPAASTSSSAISLMTLPLGFSFLMGKSFV